MANTPTPNSLDSFQVVHETLGLDITDTIFSFTTYQSLETPFATGRMVINDLTADGILFNKTLPEDKITLKVQVQGSKTILAVPFRVLSINHVTFGDDLASIQFEVTLVSPETLVNLTSKTLRKSFQNITIDGVIKDILQQDLKSSKRLNLTKTIPPLTTPYIVPNLSAIGAITELVRKRAVGEDNSPVLFFYETLSPSYTQPIINLTTLKAITAKTPPKANAYTFHHATFNDDSRSSDFNLKSIISLTCHQLYDVGTKYQVTPSNTLHFSFYEKELSTLAQGRTGDDPLALFYDVVDTFSKTNNDYKSFRNDKAKDLVNFTQSLWEAHLPGNFNLVPGEKISIITTPLIAKDGRMDLILTDVTHTIARGNKYFTVVQGVLYNPEK